MAGQDEQLSLAVEAQEEALEAMAQDEGLPEAPSAPNNFRLALPNAIRCYLKPMKHLRYCILPKIPLLKFLQKFDAITANLLCQNHCL